MDFRFPNTQFYNSDLRELLAMYKHLVEEYSGLKTAIDECKEIIDNFSEYIGAEIQKALESKFSEIDNKMAMIENDFTKMESDLSSLKNEVVDKTNDMTLRIDELADDLYGVAQDLRNELGDILNYLERYKTELNDNFEYQIHLMYKYIDEYVTRLDRLSVTNPFNGIFEDIQLVIDEIGNYLISGYGLTAKEYDNMEITAAQYDNLHISAMNYSMRGFFMFFEYFYMKMRSPFTGKMETYSEVINDLVNLHKDALTAQMYDNLLLTSDGYDLIAITAYNYDWHGKVIATQAI